MTRRTTVILGLAIAAGFSGGCGTLANTVWTYPEPAPKRVYGGVAKDWETARQFNADTSYQGRRVAICAAVDLPYSAIGDTITLPYVLACRWGIIPESSRTKDKAQQTTPAGTSPPPQPGSDGRPITTSPPP
jgi:uncharacterized protein YceK